MKHQITIQHYRSLTETNGVTQQMIANTVNDHYVYNPEMEYIVAETQEGDPVGVLACLQKQTHDEVCELFVDDAFRNNGIGTMLLTTFEYITKHPVKKLQVYSGNEEAIGLYAKFNYEPEDPNRANIVMVKHV